MYLYQRSKTLLQLKDVLLITPPFTQLNTPYPATAYLKGFLNTKNISSFQLDLGIEVILALFTKEKLNEIFEIAEENNTIKSVNAQRIFNLRNDYLSVLEGCIAFLQGKNDTFAHQLCSDDFLPRASRFEGISDLEWAFGEMGTHDKAKHLVTLYLEDLGDFINETLDENFGFSRYAEKLGMSANSFDELSLALSQELNFIDQVSLGILEKCIEKIEPKLVCFSVPFPGNLYSAFRAAKYLKQQFPHTKIAMGGGFANTELRSLNDPRVFDYFDFITLDDGELPIELLCEYVLNSPEKELLSAEFKRTFVRIEQKVHYLNTSKKTDYKQDQVGTPDYSDLSLTSYLSVIEVANPMHRLWSDGRWNKLTMAHGCYWGKCTFCDISLDYIKIYEPIAAKLLVDRVEELIEQTGERGFHFVDEAAPPSLMKQFALEIIRRKITITWWTNIRFEKNFTADLCYLLKASGCIAVSGGLEVASDRLLQLIDKGVTVEQVAIVTKNFTEASIMVHAYLMYGYPTQTIQETVDSLEMVRQLFEAGILKSGFWHQFALTAHSPIGLNPEEFGVKPLLKPIHFANNDLEFTDKTGIDHSKFSYGLKKSLFNFMHGIGFELPLNEWFEFKIPRTTIPRDYIKNCLQQTPPFFAPPTNKVIWLGSQPSLSFTTKSKRGETWETAHLQLETKLKTLAISLDKAQGIWLAELLKKLHPTAPKLLTLGEIKANFEEEMPDFELFWYSKPINQLRKNGLLVI